MKLLDTLIEYNEDLKGDIVDYIVNQRFEYINNDSSVGFFTWEEMVRGGKLYIFVNNLYLDPPKRNMKNLLYLRKFFREKYPNMEKCYWWNDHRRKFTYGR